jgi:hypothetical protein
MLPRIEVFVNNEWVSKAEGARAQLLIDSLTSDPALAMDAALTKEPGLASMPADTRAVMRSTKAHGRYGAIVGLFSGAYNSAKVGALSDDLCVVVARIFTGIEPKAE